MENRLVELETRAAFLDHTIEELNDVIVKQQNQIDQLTLDMRRIQDQLHHVTSSLPEGTSLRE